MAEQLTNEKELFVYLYGKGIDEQAYQSLLLS